MRHGAAFIAVLLSLTVAIFITSGCNVGRALTVAGAAADVGSAVDTGAAADAGGGGEVWNCLPPLLGFSVCLYLWLSLGWKAKMAGLCWLAAGVLYGAWRTSFFTKPLPFARIESDDTPPQAASV